MTMKLISMFALIVLFASPAVFAQPAPAVRIEGRLFERGTKRPLAEFNVFILPAKLKATTEADGRFVFESVPEGEFTFVVNATDYIKLEKRDTARVDGNKPRALYLQRATYQGLEATVVGKIEKRDDARKSLKTEEFLTMPGSGGDPVKAIQNMPGVARVQGGSSQVVIQGSAPQDTEYLFDDNQVPLVFHFGGLTSVITPEAVEQVDYFSAGYGPEYGNAMGGIVGLRTRNPARDRRKGFLFADTVKAGGLIEGPIDEKSSFLVTGRYSYLGYVLKAIIKDNPSFDLTVAPAFADLAAVYERRHSPKDDIRVVLIGSNDELKFLFKEPVRTEPSLRGNFSMNTKFYRLIPQWTHRFDGGSIGRFSAGLGQDLVRVDVGENFFDLNSTVITQRAEVETKVSPEWTSTTGMNGDVTRNNVSLRLPRTNGSGGVSSPISGTEIAEVSIARDDFNLGAYWRGNYKPNGSLYTWMPGARLDYIGPTRQLKPVPRLGARYTIDEFTFLRAAVGQYFQAPEPQENASDFGNPDLKAPHAWHFVFGGEKDLRAGSSRGFIAQSNLFYKTFNDLVISSSRAIVRDGVATFERYSNEGAGRAYGAEFMIRYEGKPWTGWLAYTLSRSFRTEPNQGEHVFRYDQTHNLNLMAAYDFANDWKLSSRFRYVTGNPVTPVTGGTFDADNDVYTPTRGPFYSERLEPFVQLDLRLDKKWVYDTWLLWGYIDIQNITNRENPENIRYSYDYSQKRTVSGLPTLPTIGVRGEF
jgi:hypothetical protein